MKLSDLVATANGNLFRAKLRTSLTVLAVFIGAFTLTLTNGVGQGLNDYIEQQAAGYEGQGVLFVSKKPPEGAAVGFGAKVIEYREASNDVEIDPAASLVTFAQIERLSKQFPEVRSVAPTYGIDAEYLTLEGKKKYVTRVTAAPPGMTQKLKVGRQIDGDGQVILQYDVAKAFDTNLAALVGREAILVYKSRDSNETRTAQLKIVGVAPPSFSVSPISTIDLSAARRIYEAQQKGAADYGKFAYFSLQLNTTDAHQIDAVKRALSAKGLLAQTYEDQNKSIFDAINLARLGINAFAFVALLAASFGIINTLVIAVMERSKEIGLQRALGMSRGAVFLLFSLESVLLGLWGAILGVVLAGAIGMWASYYIAQHYLGSFAGYEVVAFSVTSIAKIILLICAIAFAAGVFPALRASRLNPIEALRYE